MAILAVFGLYWREDDDNRSAEETRQLGNEWVAFSRDRISRAWRGLPTCTFYLQFIAANFNSVQPSRKEYRVITGRRTADDTSASLSQSTIFLLHKRQRARKTVFKCNIKIKARIWDENTKWPDLQKGTVKWIGQPYIGGFDGLTGPKI